MTKLTLCVGFFLIATTANAQNLALNKPTTASDTAEIAVSNATDGNLATRWASDRNRAQSSLVVDLGASYALSRVVVNWEYAYGRDYDINVSADNVTWTTAKQVRGNTTLINDHAISATGRYVRMNGLVKASGYGYSIWEFEVYGSGGPVTPPVPPTVPPTNSFPVTCTAPTQRTDGTPVSSLTYTFVVNGVDYPVWNVCRYDPVNPAPGTYTIAVKAQDSSGISDPTNPVTIVVAAPTVPPVIPPTSPVTVGFAAGVTQIPVYGLTATGTRSSTVVGVINTGVPCLGAQLLTYRNQGYRKVPRANVLWHGTTPTDSAVASCK